MNSLLKENLKIVTELLNIIINYRGRGLENDT